MLAQHHLDPPVRLVAGTRALAERIALCISIIGIPLGLANFKLIPVSPAPFGRAIVPVADESAFIGAGATAGSGMAH